jgi:hypothetical protein
LWGLFYQAALCLLFGFALEGYEAKEAMNTDWNPVAGGAAIPAIDTTPKATSRRPSPKVTASSLLSRVGYWIYERRLLDQVKQEAMPHHIGIILDGNRRYGRQRGLSDPYEIYYRGAEKLDNILNWCSELSIPAVTLWVFSAENLKRSEAEVGGILAAIETKVAALADDPFTHQNRIRIQAIGRLDVSPGIGRCCNPEGGNRNGGIQPNDIDDCGRVWRTGGDR